VKFVVGPGGSSLTGSTEMDSLSSNSSKSYSILGAIKKFNYIAIILFTNIYEYLWKNHPNLAVPILQGKFFGRKWIIGSTQVGCALGNYESGQRILFERIIATVISFMT